MRVLQVILALSVMSIASAEPIKSTYNLSEVNFIDAVGWYWTRDLSLVLRDGWTNPWTRSP